MAFTSNDIQFSVVFDDKPQITINDLIGAGYSSYGLTPSAVTINLSILNIDTNDVVYSGALSTTGGTVWSWNITTLPLNINGTLLDGNYQITYTVNTTYSQTITHYFNYTRPKADLELSYSCGTPSQSPYVRSKDNTIYTIYKNGTPISATPTYTLHQLNFPPQAQTSPIVQGTPLSILTTPQVFTSPEYLATINAHAIFLIENYIVAYNNQLITTATVYYKAYINTTTKTEVFCDECTCLYWECYNSLWEKYQETKGKNSMEASRYKSILIEISINYMMYHLGTNCGNDGTKFCKELKELAVSMNCTCNYQSGKCVQITSPGGLTPDLWVSSLSMTSNTIGNTTTYTVIQTYNDASTAIIGTFAVTNGTNGSNGSALTAGSGAPSGGSDHDFYINTASAHWDFYEKLTGTWTLLGTLKGTDGTDGTNGTTILGSLNPNQTITLASLYTPVNFSNGYYTFSSDLLSEVNNKLIVNACFNKNITGSYNSMVGIVINGTSYPLTHIDLEQQVNCIFEILTLTISTGTYICAIKNITNTKNDSYSIIYGTDTITSGVTTIAFYTSGEIGTESELIYSYVEQSKQ